MSALGEGIPGMEYVQQCTLHKLPQVAGHKMGRPNLTGSIGTWFTCLLEVTDQGAKDRCTLHAHTYLPALCGAV